MQIHACLKLSCVCLSHSDPSASVFVRRLCLKTPSPFSSWWSIEGMGSDRLHSSLSFSSFSCFIKSPS